MGGCKSKKRIVKRKKLWLVREIELWGGKYELYVGNPPSNKKLKRRINNRRWSSFGIKGCNFIMIFCPEEFERFIPRKYHLPLGGGAVELECK